MIVINLDKAKLIGHSMRRAAREKEFQPYDEIIAKQIPGKGAAAEASRQEIRERYEAMQVEIDAAASPEEIKQALKV